MPLRPGPGGGDAYCACACASGEDDSSFGDVAHVFRVALLGFGSERGGNGGDRVFCSCGGLIKSVVLSDDCYACACCLGCHEQAAGLTWNR
jgi:hypothetical protein